MRVCLGNITALMDMIMVCAGWNENGRRGSQGLAILGGVLSAGNVSLGWALRSQLILFLLPGDPSTTLSYLSSTTFACITNLASCHDDNGLNL